MKTRNIFWLSAAALLMTACTNEENSPMNPSSMPIRFDAGIAAATRVADGQWETGDKIGVSMRSEAITAEENIPYVAGSTSGDFSAESTALKFPDPASDVTFYAYYPYSEGLSGDNLTFAVDGKTDVLYATPQPVAADAQTSNTVELSFNHALSLVALNTSGFPEDIEVTLSESYSDATLNITTGAVTGNTSAVVSIPLEKTVDNVYSAIMLPCTSQSKTLTIKSLSESKQWEYTLTANYTGGYQYTYNATLTDESAIQLTANQIAVWTPAAEEDLQGVTETEIELTIAQYLAGKTFVPNMNYFYDSLGEDGNGWLNNPDTYFGEHIGSPNPWDQYLYNGCKIASISFYYDEKNEKLMANSVNAIGDNKDQTEAIDGIEVTIDEANRRLTFSKEPFNYNWIFTEILDPTKSDVTYWQLIAHTGGSNYNVDFTSTPIKDFFKDDQLHLTYWNGGNNNCYFVVNFVQKEISETAAE